MSRGHQTEVLMQGDVEIMFVFLFQDSGGLSGYWP